MHAPDDTIAAIATASGEAGIAVIRLSGPDSLKIADQLFTGTGPKPSQRMSHVILHGRIGDDAGAIDDVLLLIMRAPHSYTREDVVEIQCHGGPVPARRVLRRVLDTGARPAEPGEFTRRAFINGRIDLLQAEAVLDLVRAQSDRAAAAALDQLDGSLTSSFATIYNGLLSAAADIEATLDFPEDDLPAAAVPEILSRITATQERVRALIATWDEGRLLREGARVVITGRPNVGKSTLLNRLLGYERAIVSRVPGTTRDTIEETFVLDGIPLRLVDTAGLRNTECEVEREGIRRTHCQIERAALHLHVIDASQPLDDEDLEYVGQMRNRPCLLILNKTDLGRQVSQADLPEDVRQVETCLLHGQGLPEILAAMRGFIEAGVDLHAVPHAVISERHFRLLSDVSASVEQAIHLLRQAREGSEALASEVLRDALETIGKATGRTYDEDLLETVFSRFCVGK
jgi:tRNA modification GTPase